MEKFHQKFFEKKTLFFRKLNINEHLISLEAHTLSGALMIPLAKQQTTIATTTIFLLNIFQRLFRFGYFTMKWCPVWKLHLYLYESIGPNIFAKSTSQKNLSQMKIAKRKCCCLFFFAFLQYGKYVNCPALVYTLHSTAIKNGKIFRKYSLDLGRRSKCYSIAGRFASFLIISSIDVN